MKILLTNSGLGGLGGAQSFLHELGSALIGLGHEVAGFSSDPSDRDGDHPFPVAGSIGSLPFEPEVIHGQHHLTAMTAILGLPGIPAVYHCHGAVWRECPPRHPRIRHYLAMSSTLAFRMEIEGNLSRADISVFPNTIDLERFRLVRSPPDIPRRALFYNKMHTAESPTVAAARHAAGELGIKLEFAGRHFGRMLAEPETTLPEYDIVFASGKSAIDAIACGCAVVVLGRNSCGELVRPENFARLREVNFSIAVNSPPPCRQKIAGELRGYSASGTRKVTAMLREAADIRQAATRLVSIHESVLRAHRAFPPEEKNEALAVARYLRGLTPIFALHERVMTARHLGGGDRAVRSGREDAPG
jgi:hypothetical protein